MTEQQREALEALERIADTLVDLPDGIPAWSEDIATVEEALSHAEGEAGWRSGYPEYDGDGGVCHIPLDGHPDFMVVAFNSDGNLVDGCGDDVGYGLEDVERWQPVGSHPAPQVAVPEDRK